jgi:hypothetical protein
LQVCPSLVPTLHSRSQNADYLERTDSRVPINERERNDYFNPPQALFCDHCDDVAARYDLHPGGLVHKERVLDISFGPVSAISATAEKFFTVRTDQGIRYSSIVVAAVGPGNQPRIPDIPGMLPSPACPTPPQACHAMQIREFPDATVKQKISSKRRTNILIIGGGLTSAQLADLAIRKGVSKVWLLTRGPLRVKVFDVDLSWMGKFKNVQQARFWQADSDQERVALMKEARGGGSVTPPYYKVLKRHIADGSLRLLEHTTLVDARFEAGVGGGAWRVKTDPEVEGLPPMDYIYFATGVQTNFETLPWLQTMLKTHPIPGHGGFPCLNDDLMWKDGVPFFLAGRLAALKLGPAAPNLGGARAGAERIAWGIEEVMRKAQDVGHVDQRQAHNRNENRDELDGFTEGRGSMFRSLAEVSL